MLFHVKLHVCRICILTNSDLLYIYMCHVKWAFKILRINALFLLFFKMSFRNYNNYYVYRDCSSLKKYIYRILFILYILQQAWLEKVYIWSKITMFIGNFIIFLFLFPNFVNNMQRFKKEFGAKIVNFQNGIGINKINLPCPIWSYQIFKGSLKKKSKELKTFIFLCNFWRKGRKLRV